MPNRGRLQGEPLSYVADGDWLTGELIADAPVEVRACRIAAQRLELAIHDMPRGQAADLLAISRQTLYDLLKGRNFLDTLTLARAEAALSRSLWPTPDELRSQPRRTSNPS